MPWGQIDLWDSRQAPPSGPGRSTSMITAGSVRGKCSRPHSVLEQVRWWPPVFISVGLPQVPQNWWVLCQVAMPRA